MRMNDWIHNLVESDEKKAIPVLSFPCVSLLGITVRELIGNSDLQAKGMKMVADRIDSGASVSMMDLSVEAEAFGSKTRISDDEVPTVVGSIVNTEDEANALAIPAVGTGRTGLYVEAIEKACKLVTDRPVLAGVIGPFSLAGRLMDVTKALVNCVDEPDMVHICLEKTTKFLIEYINAYKAIGSNGVVMAEPLTGLLSPRMAKTFSSVYVKQIVDAAEDGTIRSDIDLHIAYETVHDAFFGLMKTLAFRLYIQSPTERKTPPQLIFFSEMVIDYLKRA